MVLVLVLATACCLVAAQALLVRRRRKIAVEERLIAESESLRAGSVLLHPGMAWARPRNGRAITVGAAEFAVDFAGPLARVELPPVGERLEEGDAAVTLVSRRGRRLALPTPVAGLVLAVHPDPGADPTGWLLRVKPRGAGPALLSREAAARWVEEARALVLARLAPAVGPLAQDGGVWTRAWGELLDDRTWGEIREQLFPAMEGPGAEWRRTR